MLTKKGYICLSISETIFGCGAFTIHCHPVYAGAMLCAFEVLATQDFMAHHHRLRVASFSIQRASHEHTF